MKKIPDVIICANRDCARRLDPRVYRVTLSGHEDESLITRIYDPKIPYMAIQCSTCGHYTVYTLKPID
jgi:hypothetical protein